MSNPPHQPLLLGSPNWFKARCAEVRHQTASGRLSYREVGAGLLKISVDESRHDDAAWARLEKMYEALTELPEYQDTSTWFPMLEEIFTRELPGCWKLIPARKRAVALEGVAAAICDEGLTT
jgi:hypothetical protein